MLGWCGVRSESSVHRFEPLSVGCVVCSDLKYYSKVYIARTNIPRYILVWSWGAGSRAQPSFEPWSSAAPGDPGRRCRFRVVSHFDSLPVTPPRPAAPVPCPRAVLPALASRIRTLPHVSLLPCSLWRHSD